MQRRGIVTQTSTEKQRPQAGRVLCRAISQVGTVTLASLETAAEKGLADRMAGLELGMEPGSARPWGKNCFSFCSDSSYCTLSFSAQSHKDWQPLSNSKASLLTPHPSAHAMWSPILTLSTTSYDARRISSASSPEISPHLRFLLW